MTSSPRLGSSDYPWRLGTVSIACAAVDTSKSTVDSPGTLAPIPLVVLVTAPVHTLRS